MQRGREIKGDPTHKRVPACAMELIEDILHSRVGVILGAMRAEGDGDHVRDRVAESHLQLPHTQAALVQQAPELQGKTGTGSQAGGGQGAAGSRLAADSGWPRS